MVSKTTEDKIPRGNTMEDNRKGWKNWFSPKPVFNFIHKKLGPKTSPVLAGIWPDEEAFLSAIKSLKQQGYKNFSAITPCPVHGLEELLEIKRSWIPYVTFVCGAFGCLFGLWFTWWTSAVNWPLIVGGKPFWSLPAFVPVIFECTILLGALSSVGALLYACRLPSVDPPVLDPDLTSHKFAIYFPLKNQHKTDKNQVSVKSQEKSSENRQKTAVLPDLQDREPNIRELEEQMKSLGAEKVLHTPF